MEETAKATMEVAEAEEVEEEEELVVVFAVFKLHIGFCNKEKIAYFTWSRRK